MHRSIDTSCDAASLAEGAAAILATAHPAGKVALSRALAARWRAGGMTIGLATPPSCPARPARPVLHPPRDMPRRRNFGSPAGRVALLHALAHIELNAIDLAWDLIARFSGAALPYAFFADWLVVAAEEAEHFALLAARLEALGAAYGDLPAHDGLWEAAAATAHDLIARLAVVPLVLEARGLDVTPEMMLRLERAGDSDSAAILTRIYEDEIGHVAVGVHWFELLCRERGLDPESTFHDRVRRHFTGALKAPFNRDARDRAGFPAVYYEKLGNSQRSPHPNPPPQAGEGATRPRLSLPRLRGREGPAPLGVGGWGLEAMRFHLSALSTALLVAVIGVVHPAQAETAELHIMRPLDLAALPLLVMEHEHLIERTAEAMGLGAVTVAWTAPGSTDPIQALAAGESDFVAADLAPFLFAADASLGTPGEIRALAALAERPYVLVTRNPAVKTIRDFGGADRIALPALKNSGPALMLQMAAAQEWGAEHYGKLDALALARPDAAAASALRSDKGEIDAHFSRSPYADDELANPAIHRVMDSFDIAGPHSAAVLAVTMHFRAANPTLCAAVLSALEEADDFIKNGPGAAAEIFAAMVKEQSIPLEDLTDIIGDPDLAYRTAPAGVMRLALFIHQTGRLKHRLAAWQDLFLPEARDLPGN